MLFCSLWPRSSSLKGQSVSVGYVREQEHLGSIFKSHGKANRRPACAIDRASGVSDHVVDAKAHERKRPRAAGAVAPLVKAFGFRETTSSAEVWRPDSAYASVEMVVWIAQRTALS